MSTNNEEEQGIRILSFDSGGPGTYSQLLTVEECMQGLGPDTENENQDPIPANYFELMGGVGFGGLVAIMLGHLRMSVEEATEALLPIAQVIFPLDIGRQMDPESRSKALKEALEAMLRERGLQVDLKMKDDRLPATTCKVALYAATAANLSHYTVLRTYGVRGNKLNPTIVEAICATMAVSDFFSPVRIGPRMREQSFVGGGLGANNPARELLKEASTIFGVDRRVAHILSIGCGRPKALSLDYSDTGEAVIKLLRNMAYDCESVAEELSIRFSYIPAYLRLNVDKGMEDLNMDDWSNLGTIGSHTAAYLETPAITKALERSVRMLKERTGTVALGQINQSRGVRVTAKEPPALSPFYVARQREWRFMHSHLVETTGSDQKIFAVTGMGGCGKTQMVSYFLQKTKTLFPRVVFANASSTVSIKKDLQSWAQSLGNGHEQDQWEDSLRILATAPEHERWLLVLDNADDRELDLVPFIPRCSSGTVVITSRNRDVGNLANAGHLELGQMEPEEALSALLQAARRQSPLPPQEMESAQSLVNDLGCLALALVHAGAYCYQFSSTVGGIFQAYTFTQYLALFKSKRAELMKQTGPASLDGYQWGVYTTLDLSYQALPPFSRDFLHVLSYFQCSEIALAMLEAAAKNSFKDPRMYYPRLESHTSVVDKLCTLLCTEGIWNEFVVQGTIQALRSFSLVSTSINSDSLFLQLHPLVQTWAQDMIAINQQDFRHMAQQVVTSACVEENSSNFRYLVSHINHALHGENAHMLHINDQVAAGRVLKESAYHHEAEKLLSQALKALQGDSAADTVESLLIAALHAETLCEQGRWKEAELEQIAVWKQQTCVLGAEHPDTIQTVMDLSTTYRFQGRWKEAETLMLKVLEQRRELLGNDHQQSLKASRHLAAIYHHQGRWSEAEELYVKELDVLRATLGKAHPETLMVTGDLAATYQLQGRCDDAEKAQLYVLEQRKAILGPDHPHTHLAAENLACTYNHKGQYREAERLWVEVQEWRKRFLGGAHPDTLRVIGSLAVGYGIQGRLDDSKELHMEVWETRKRIMGNEHTETILAAANLAATYQLLGRYKEAEELQLEVLEQRRRTQGLENPESIKAITQLALSYRSQGRLDDAEAGLSEALELQSRLLGIEHPDTIETAASLASLYVEQKRRGDAEKLSVELLERSSRVLGYQHLTTTVITATLAENYIAQERWIEAEKLQLDVAKHRRNTLGPQNPFTLGAVAMLANNYYNQGSQDKAEKLSLEVWSQRGTLRPNHSSATIASSVLSRIYDDQERWDEAEKHSTESLDEQRKTLGSEHSTTLGTIYRLAIIYGKQEEWGKAADLELELLENKRKVLGNDHSETVTAAAELASTYTKQKLWIEAEKLGLEVLQQWLIINGEVSWDTYKAWSLLGLIYARQGRWQEAEPRFVAALECAMKVTDLGKEHPQTQITVRNMIKVFETLGKLDDAERTKLFLNPEVD